MRIFFFWMNLTTGMSRAEIDTLFKIMDDLKKKEVNMIYISHHLDEVFRVW